MTTAESSPATISERVDVYDARVGWRNLLPDWRALYGFRHLLRNLVIRDLKVRYKSSLLGVVWSLLNPLLMMVVFTLVFGVLAGNDIRDYSVFFLVGLLPWNFFNGALLGSTLSITANAALVKKVYFPRELLPLASIFSNLVNFGIALIVLVVFLYATGLGLTVHALWVIPLLITQIIFTLGLGLLLGSLQVFYRDVMMILDVVMLAWFFLTPVMYSLSRFGTQTVILGMELVPEQVIRWLNPDGLDYRRLPHGAVGRYDARRRHLARPGGDGPALPAAHLYHGGHRPADWLFCLCPHRAPFRGGAVG